MEYQAQGMDHGRPFCRRDAQLSETKHQNQEGIKYNETKD